MGTDRNGFWLAVVFVLSGQAAWAATSPCSVAQGTDVQGRDRLTVVGTIAKQIINLTLNTTGTIAVSVDCNGDGDLTDASMDWALATYTPSTSFYTIEILGKDVLAQAFSFPLS